MKIRKNSLLIILVLTTILFSCAPQNSKKNEIVNAVNSLSIYTTDILLDDKGRSRCDYSIINGEWKDYEVPWHTGQIIYALTDAYEITGNEKYLNAAKKAGDWWCSLKITDNPKLNGMVKSIHGVGLEKIVFATMSDGSAGLYKLFGITGDSIYAKTPTIAGDWMLKNMWNEKYQIFYDRVDPITGEVIGKDKDWNEENRDELFLLARPNNEGSLYNDMYEFTKDETYKEQFIIMCNSLLKYQDENGLWMAFGPNHKSENSFHPRFNLWYAESLIHGYELTKNKEYLNAAIKTARMYAKVQKKDGTIYYKNYTSGSSDKGSICGSAVAFAGSIWLRLIEHGAGEEFKGNIEASLKWILQNRYSEDHPDKNLAGAVINTRVKFKQKRLIINNRDVGTSFGIRFLVDYYKTYYK